MDQSHAVKHSFTQFSELTELFVLVVLFPGMMFHLPAESYACCSGLAHLVVYISLLCWSVFSFMFTLTELNALFLLLYCVLMRKHVVEDVAHTAS